MGFGYMSERGNDANEDFAHAGPDFGVLLDGASGLSASRLFPDRNATDAQWFSHTVGIEVVERVERGQPVPRALEEAVRGAKREVERVAGGRGVHAGELLAPAPSATFVAVRIGEETVDIWSLGDSPVAVLSDDGLDVSSDEALAALDERALDAMVRRCAGLALTGRQKRASVDDVLRRNRGRMNRPDGYYILDPSGAGLGHMRRVSYDRRSVRSVAAFSDGFFDAFGLYGIASLDEFMLDPSVLEARRIVDRMRVVESSDPDFERYPRLKRGDDASMFFIVP